MSAHIQQQAQNAEETSAKQLLQAVTGGNLNGLDRRQRQLIASAIAFYRGAMARNRGMPTKEVVGEEVAGVIAAFAADPAKIDNMVTALKASDADFALQLDTPVMWSDAPGTPPNAPHTVAAHPTEPGPAREA